MPRKSIRGHVALKKTKGYETFLVERSKASVKSLSYYILEYLKWMSMQNYSVITIGNRKRYLGYFAIWALENKAEEIQGIGRELLDNYKKYLFEIKKTRNGQPLTAHAQWSRLEPLRSFFSWMARKYHILYNPASELDLPRLGQTLPGQILTDEQVDAILSQPDLNTRRGIRDRTILEVFYSTGIRRLELCNLSVYDINFDRDTIMIHQGKCAKDRIVPLGSRCREWLSRYIEQVRPHFAGKEQNDILFLTNAGDPLTTSYLTRAVREYIEAAGVKIDGSCHIFRHSMATLMLENGADIRFIQEMLGHARLSTTQIYTKVSIEKLKEVHRNTHPAER
jgi:integrase/recombinase XerD